MNPSPLPPIDGGDAVLLLSGGLDSTALAAWVRPAACLFIDYGQRPASAERRAATAVSDALGLELDVLAVDLSSIGAGLLSPIHVDLPGSPSPEWWPFRNQILATLAAAWCVTNTAPERPLRRVLLASVRGDGDRHTDGTAAFYAQLDRLVAIQEGALRVDAPCLGVTTAELLVASRVDDSILGWTHSCHCANTGCGACPGCHKRAEALQAAGRADLL